VTFTILASQPPTAGSVATSTPGHLLDAWYVIADRLVTEDLMEYLEPAGLSGIE
jgi:hypothetical protein